MKMIKQIKSDFYGALNYGGAKAKIDGREVSFGSVRGYAAYNIGLWNVHAAKKVADEAAAIGKSVGHVVAKHLANAEAKAQERRETMHWINLRAVCIHNGPRDTSYDGVPELTCGEIVDFDGILFQILPDHNKNYKLVRV